MNAEIYTPKQITLKKTAYLNLLRTVIESASKEPTGFLFGFKRKNKGTFINAYPVITADRQPTSVSYGNDNAIKRVRSFHTFMHSLKAIEGKWVGGYHSHPRREGDNMHELTQLSEDDLEFIDIEMTAHKQKSWTEILIRFNEKKYETKQKLGIEVKSYKNKMKVILTDTPYHKYHLLFTAYFVRRKQNEIENKEIVYKRKSSTRKLSGNYVVKELKVRTTG